jgi:hypothetical protein
MHEAWTIIVLSAIPAGDGSLTVALHEQAAQLKAQAAELVELRAGLAKQQQLLDSLAANVARLSH